jgi:hypothetical protein
MTFLEFIKYAIENNLYPVKEIDDQHLKGRTDLKYIYVNKNLSENEKRFVIIHELAHIYFEEIGRKIKIKQPPREIAWEGWCDLYACIYLYTEMNLKPREIFSIYKQLGDTAENRFRALNIYSVLEMLEKRCKK